MSSTISIKASTMIKKNVFYFGFMLTTVIGLQSCKTAESVADKAPDNVSEATEISFEYLASGYLTGDGSEEIEEGRIVVNSQEGWDDLVASMNTVNRAIKNQSIDFTKYTLLGYFDEIRGSGGYTVDVISISQIGEMIHINIVKSAPKEDAIDIMTQPYTLVLIDKTDKEVMLNHQ